MRLKRLHVSLIAVGLLVAALLLYGKQIDIRFNGERLRDSVARWRGGADWAEAQSVGLLDYGWVSKSAGGQDVRHMVQIAHALGGAGNDSANTLASARKSLDVGFRLLEVDIWLADDGTLHCHHGPSAPVPRADGADRCTLERLLDLVDRWNAWLVLDMKTDFVGTGEAVLERVVRRDEGLAQHLIFQIYQPGQLKVFNEWATRLRLPGPIVTAYASPRSLAHVAAQLPRLGVRVMTVPLYRLAALRSRPEGVLVYVHPVHDCASWKEVRAAGVQGAYTPSDLRCDGTLDR